MSFWNDSEIEKQKKEAQRLLEKRREEERIAKKRKRKEEERRLKQDKERKERQLKTEAEYQKTMAESMGQTGDGASDGTASPQKVYRSGFGFSSQNKNKRKPPTIGYVPPKDRAREEAGREIKTASVPDTPRLRRPF